MHILPRIQFNTSLEKEDIILHLLAL